jgi:hypothetical protein
VDLKGSLEKADIDLEPMMRDDQPNEAKILSQIDKVAQARAELEKANARFLLAIRAKLTPEQWKQLRALRGEGGQQHQGWQRDGHGMERRGQGGMMHGQCGMMHGDGGMMMNHHQQAPSGQSAPQGAVPQGAAPQDSGAPAPQQ